MAMPTGQRPSRRRFLRDAYAGQGAEQAIQSIAIRLTRFGQVIDAAHFVSQCIGNAETCSRAKYAAAGIRHCHFDEPRVRRDIADSAVRMAHDTPQIQCTHGDQPAQP